MSDWNKPFDFSADMDHDPDPGIINGILPLQVNWNLQNFVGSAALWEVFGLLMLLLFIYLFIYLF